MAHASTCSVDGCDKAAKKTGLCDSHYQRRRNLTLGTCSDPLCTRKVKARGLCNEHYLVERAGGLTCSVEGCSGYARTRGYCSAHYYRWNKTGAAGEAELRRKPPRTCGVSACANAANGRDDLCQTHRQRLRQFGDVEGRRCECGQVAVRGSDLCRPHFREAAVAKILAGDRVDNKTNNGYLVLKVLDETLLVHRVVMEHILGRPLEPFENVHHKNGQRADNRPENLELWVKPQPSGQRPEDLVDWVLDHYLDLVEHHLKERHASLKRGQPHGRTAGADEG